MSLSISVRPVGRVTALGALTLLLVAATMPSVVAQPSAPIATAVNYPASSGLVSNGRDIPWRAWSAPIQVTGAHSLQLLFDTVEIGPDDAVILTNPRDGETQRLDHLRLKQWRNHTAWFNGDRVDVAIELAPGSTGQIVIRTVYAGIQPILGTSNTICGSGDERTLSNDARVCRLVMTAASCGSCTGWLISSTNTILGAGHCADPLPDWFVIAEFNTPASNAAGCAQHPPVADQYPVDQSTIQFENLGLPGGGDDWAVARLHPNSTGTTAFGNQGSFFSLATTLPAYIPPFVVPNLRVTGHGDDSNNATRAYDQQTDTGTHFGYVGDQIRHRVDTEGGNSGSPIIDTATGLAIGIHTNGGCGTSSTSSNSGTSILRPALQTAIAQTVGCSTQFLASSQSGAADPVTCDFQVFNGTPAANSWVGFGITSASDWDLIHEDASSVLGGGSCDFIIANGRLGTVAPTSGELNRFSGGSNAYADLLEAQTFAVGETETSSWGSTDVMQMFEFEVTAAGSFDITVSGSSDLNWRLYAPGSNAGWRSRTSTTLEASGTVGLSTYQGATLNTGWHVIVVYKDDGVAAVSPTSLAVTVCSATGSILLTDNVPTTITDPCQDFRITAVAGRWNVVGISSPSDWDLVLGSATSYTGGADFALANGHLGTISPIWGQVNRFSGSSDGTMEHQDALSLSATGSNSVDAFAAGEILELREVNLTSTGTYAITVVGDSSISWRFYAPQSDANWVPEASSIASGNGGGGTVNVTVSSTGYHALLLYRNNGPSTDTTTVMSNICSVSTSTTLSGFGVATAAGPCAPFTFSPESGRWNAVGVASASDWDIGVGTGYSRSGGGVTDFVIANGHNGTVTPSNGVSSRFSGADSARLMRSYTVTLNVGTPYTIAGWPANRVIRMFEFDIPSPGSYDITLDNAPNLSWRLHEPGTDASWRSDNDYVALGAAGGTTLTRTFSTTGWHAISVYHATADPSSQPTFSVTVEPTPNPAPSTSSLSPSSAFAGGSSFTLTVNGSNFISGSSIRWNGSNLTTTYVNSGQLTASVSSALIASAGTASVDVETPAPGGGISGSQTFTINNPAPTLSSLSPSSATAGSGAFTLNVSGSNFNGSSVIRWNGLSQSTTLVSSTLVRCTIPAGFITNAGTRNVQVFNPSPGGGITPISTFTVNNPVPTVASVSPASAVVGSGPLAITVNGANFNSSSVIRFNGLGLATTLVSANAVTATVPGASLSTAGSVLVSVENPAPGGGLGSTNFTVENPTPSIVSVAPTFAVAGDATFTMNVNGSDFINGDSQVRWNGGPLPTSFVSSNQLQATVSAALIGTPGTANVDVETAGPGGGASGALSFPVLAPSIINITPSSIPILTAASPAQTITITGTNFHPGTVAYADGYALPTTYLNSSTLSCQVGPTVLGALRRGGLAIAVENAHTVPSNAVACVVGGLGSNAGTVTRNPLAPLPGESYGARCESGLPGFPLLLLADLTNPTPIYPWPSPAADFVLSVRGSQPAVPGDWFVVIDGIGVFGPPIPGIVYDAAGEFTLPGLTLPNPALGWSITVQGAYINPSSPVGFTLQWPRYPDQL